MIKQYATLEDTVFFWFAGNDTSGSGGDGATPAADVRLAGAAVDAIPVLSPTPVLLTHANYPAGCYELAVACTNANGFAANNTYAVFTTLAVDGQNPTGFIGSVDLKAVKTLLTGDSYAVVNHADHGNAQLVRSTTPANKLDISNTGEVGLDFANIKNATGAHTLTNITVPTCTANSDMRGTDNAALASVLGALNNVAAAGDPTDADTLMQYIKQLINVLVGTAGIGTFPSEAAPANAVSIAEVIRAIHVDVTGLNGDVMRGTDGANTTVPDAAGVVPTAVENRQEMDSNSTQLAATLSKLLKYVQLLSRSDAAIATDNATEITAINADGGSGTGDFSNQTDAEEAIRDRGDAAWTTGAGGSDRLLMVDTTIATLASQTSFTLTAGSTDDNAYRNCTIVIEDASTATQKAVGLISAYTGGTKTVALKYDPAIFTMAPTDKVYILAENALKSTLANRQLNVAADGDIAGNIDGSVASLVGHTVQTGDGYAILNNGTHGNAALETLVDEIETILKHATYGNSALQVLIAALQTDLDNGTDGLGALKTLIDAVPTASEIQTEMEENGASLLDTIRDDLANATDGLGALKTLIDAANTDLSNETDGLGALKTLIDTVNTDLSNGTDGLGALKALIEAVPTAAETKTAIEAAGSYLTLIKAKTDDLPSGIAKNVALPYFDFLMVLSSDHITPATGKTVTGQIKKDSGAFVDITNAITEVGSGIYQIASGFTQAEMNGNVITLKFIGNDCEQRILHIHTS